MKYRKLGKTDLTVSEVGFGCIPILKGAVSILPNYYNHNDDVALLIMEKAFELGCNLYDTAVVPEYGDAEIKLGKFYKKHRDEIIISDKARAYTGKDMENALSTSLRNLQTDCCDIYFVHQVAPENEKSVYANNSSIDVLQNYKEKGYIKYIGVATHHYEMAYNAASDPRVDVIQIPGNVFERGILDRIKENSDVFDNVGIILHKAYAAGVLPDYFSPKELINFVLSYPIDSALIGMGSIGHVLAAINLDPVPPILDFETVCSKLSLFYNVIPCTRCQKCKCLQGLEIESIFRYHNYYNMGHRTWAYERLLNNLEKIRNACKNCSDCVCTDKCPQKINVKEQLSIIEKDYSRRIIHMEERKLKPGKDYIGVGVGAVILREKKILLLLRKKAPEAGCWTIPGGKVEFGETVEEAILREVKEEIGAEGRIIAPLGVTNHILKEERTHFVAPRFLVEILNDPQNMEPQSHEEMRWFPIDELPTNVTMTTQMALSAFLTWNKSNL